MRQTTLLDAVETRHRRLQNLLMWTGIVLLMGSMFFFKGAESTDGAGWATLLSASAAFGLAFTTRVRWRVGYKGHTIVFENDPFRGERLIIDGSTAAKGKLGIHNTLAATLPRGDRIVATTVAALGSFRCKIVAESAADAGWLRGVRPPNAGSPQAPVPFE